MQTERDRGKRLRWVWTFAIILLIAALGALVHIRGYDITTAGAQAVWNKDDLYVFVTQNKTAFSQNVWKGLWSSAKALLGLGTKPDFFRLDLLVYHVTASKVEEHLAKGRGLHGDLLPHGGKLHAYFGDNRDTNLYQWTGSDFVRLSDTESREADGGYSSIRDRFKGEGWSQAYPLSIREPTDFPLTLGGVRFLLRGTHSLEPYGVDKIELIRLDEPKSTRVLYDFRSKKAFLSAEEYRRLTE